MSDVVDWYRRTLPGHANVYSCVKELVWLRRNMPCLQWNSLEFFALESGFHSSFNANDGERVFCFCRPGSQSLGNNNQVILIANCSKKAANNWTFSPWYWSNVQKEVGGKGQPLPTISGNSATLSLDPFQVRVFLS